MSIKSDVFNVLRENLLARRQDLQAREVVLCPVCLREITREEVERRGIEHIIPRAALRNDPSDIQSLGTLNQRAGITLLCRQPREIGSTRKVERDGCNGFKGRTYDWALRTVLDWKVHDPAELAHRHGVGILIMAYLAAFQVFGYEYILRPDLAEVRKQFDWPDSRVTDLLDYAWYSPTPTPGIVATESGLPFIVGGITTPTALLEIYWRRCQARLPAGHWDSKGVRTIASIISS